MSKSFKYFILIAIVLAALITADHYLVKKNPDVLNYSMAKLGEIFFELVPEGGEKVSQVFDQFVRSVEAKEVDPDQVEQIAANILNLSNQNITLTPEQAESVISVGYLNPHFSVAATIDSSFEIVMVDTANEAIVAIETLEEVKMVIPPPLRSIRPIDPKRFELLGMRLKEAVEMNEKIQLEIHSSSREEAREWNKHFQFTVKNGIRLTIDMALKDAMTEVDFKRLNKELEDLEIDKRIEWRENMARKRQEELKHKESEYQEILKFRTKYYQRIKMMRFDGALSELEHLKLLETKGYKPLVNADSIRILIEKKIKEVKKREGELIHN